MGKGDGRSNLSTAQIILVANNDIAISLPLHILVIATHMKIQLGSPCTFSLTRNYC